MTSQQLPRPVDKILAEYISLLKPVIPQLDGIYITGSIPLGDYYPNKSDLDFIAILRSSPNATVLKKIEGIHLSIERKYNNPKLNGYYITLEELGHEELIFPSFFKNKMILKRPFELDRFALLELMTSSINVYGKPASELNIGVSWRDAIEQLYQNINSYWQGWIESHSFPKPGYFLLALIPRLTEWGVLGVARQLYTLETHGITSKYGAGLYYQDRLPPEYRDILSTAIRVRKIDSTQIRPSFWRADRTLACMKFIIGEFNKVYGKQKGEGY